MVEAVGPSLLPPWSEIPLLVLAVVGVGASIVFALLWWRDRKTLRTRVDSRIKSENQRIDAELRLAEMADRMRLITDVHDSAAVSINQVIAQAEGAKFSADANPEVVTRAAAQIADTARTVLNDLRRVVNAGRAGAVEVSSGPTISTMQELFTSMEESGVVVRYEESGESFNVGSSAEIALFRIVQESLNNVRRHGGPGTTVKVSMSWSANGLQLRVEDDGTRAKNQLREQLGEDTAYSIADDHKVLTEILNGRGMRDMKARAETFGGVFSAHRVPGIGFTVSASFPTLRFHNGIHGVGISDAAQAS
jgi:signal transduction histidine kinase